VRLRTTLYSGLFVAGWLGIALAAVVGCGGDDEACTTIGCANQQSTDVTAAQGGSGGSSSGSGDQGGDLLAGDTGGGNTGLQEGQACTGVSVNAPTNPVNVMILLDRSVSMNDPVDPTVPNSPTRWEAVTSALRSFVNSALAADSRVGLQFFGLMAQDDCQVAKYATPAVGVASLGTNRTALLDAIGATRPGSFTPTAPALEGSLSYALSVAQRPENEGIPTVLVMASDGIPTECGPVGPDGVMITSFAQIVDILRSYSQPPLDAAGKPMQPPIRTYIVGTEALSANANTLAQAGGGQAFLVGQNVGLDLEAKFLDALLRIVAKPLSCEVDLPQMAPDTSQAIDFERVRVRFTAASSGSVTEYPRTDNLINCGQNKAWYYDDQVAPKKILFCQDACQSLSAGDLKIEFGCAPQRIVR
jgi:hypothetical protein